MDDQCPLPSRLTNLSQTDPTPHLNFPVPLPPVDRPESYVPAEESRFAEQPGLTSSVLAMLKRADTSYLCAPTVDIPTPLIVQARALHCGATLQQADHVPNFLLEHANFLGTLWYIVNYHPLTRRDVS
jgi:hypothetical protein